MLQKIANNRPTKLLNQSRLLPASRYSYLFKAYFHSSGFTVGLEGLSVCKLDDNEPFHMGVPLGDGEQKRKGRS